LDLRLIAEKSRRYNFILPAIRFSTATAFAEITEPLGREFAIPNRMLDVLVAEIVLQRPSIHTLIG